MRIAIGVVNNIVHCCGDDAACGLAEKTANAIQVGHLPFLTNIRNATTE